MGTRDVLLLVIALAAGACVGSFVNVVITRLPVAFDEPNEFGDLWGTQGWSVVAEGESHCDGCGRELTIGDLVPVLSWLVLRGRCRTCGAPIPAHHPLVELLVPALGALAWWRIGWGWQLGPVLWAVPVLVAVSAIDLRTLIVPTRIVRPATAILAALIVVGSVASHHPQWMLRALIGVAVLAGPLFLIWFVRPGGMGFGDVRLAVFLGALVGWRSVDGGPAAPLLLAVVCIGIAAVVGIVIGVAALGARGRQAKVPFGPALAVAAFVCCLEAGPILDAFAIGR